MTTKEKNLKKGAKAFDLLQQIKKYANACFEQGTPEYEAVIHSVSILEKNFDTGITYIILISEKRKELFFSFQYFF